jgi:aryl-alcohol dehydrogenase-like predicted oxidoreductase
MKPINQKNETSDASRIGLGGLPFGGHYGQIEIVDVISTIYAALDEGITFFDTSPRYGDGLAESLLADCLGSDRDKVIIATKAAAAGSFATNLRQSNDPTTIRRRAEESLTRLDRDYIDLYQICGADPHTPVGKTMEAMEELRSAGKIRFIGFCAANTTTLREALKHGRIDAVQLPYNAIDPSIRADILRFCRAAHIEIHACEPLCCGLLLGSLHQNSIFDEGDRRVEDKRFRGELYRRNIETVNRLRAFAYQEGLTLLQLALGWVLQNPLVKVAVCGAKNPQQIRQIVASENVNLTPEQIIEIHQIVGEQELEGAGVISE